MSLETFNTLIGIASFALGIFAVFGRLKLLTQRALSAGATHAKTMLKKREQETQLLAEHPSAFVAYCMRRLVMALLILFVIPSFSTIIKSESLYLQPWAASTLSALLPSACGILFGLVMSRSDEVIRYLRTRHNSQSSSGSTPPDPTSRPE